MDTALTWFIRIWIFIGVAVNIAAAGLAMTDSAWKGLDTFRPFSLANLVAEIILFSPAFLAFSWREKRRAKARPGRAAAAAELRREVRPAKRDDRPALREDTRSADRDDKAELQRDTRPARREDKPALRDIRSAELDEQLERIFGNVPPKRPI